MTTNWSLEITSANEVEPVCSSTWGWVEGKTASSLAALDHSHLPALVMAPKRVAETVWPAEARLWRPDLNVRLAAGDPATREAALRDEDADVVVLGRDNVKDLLRLPLGRFGTVILDESSGWKSRESVRWKITKKLTADPDVKVWELTGTPASNGYMDLWAQIYLLDGGRRLGKGIGEYRERYFREGRRIQPQNIVIEWLLREGMEEKIRSRIEDICLYMSSDGRVHLPEITYNDILVDIPDAAKKVYRTLATEMIVDIRDIFGADAPITAKNGGALASKLQQITAGFIYENDRDIKGDRYVELHQEKVKAVREVVEGTGGSPVLVFYQFIPEKEMLLREFGDQARTINEPGVIDAWNRGEVPVLLGHPASAGHGLNLQQGGHTVVWTSPTWDLEHWEQGNKRLHRSGQTHPVVIHRILANRSIDHLVRASQEGKADVQDALLAHLESPI